MAIIDGHGGTPADLAAIVWNLTEGLAIIAKTTARGLTQQQAKDLSPILGRLQLLAADLDREHLADVLSDARDRVQQQAE